jgi:hypothetical protein
MTTTRVPTDSKAELRKVKEKLAASERKVQRLERDPDSVLKHTLGNALTHVGMGLSAIPCDLATIKGMRRHVSDADLQMIDSFMESVEAAFADYRSLNTGAEVSIINI